MDLSALLEARVAVEPDGGDDQLAEIVLTPELEIELGAGWRALGIGRFRADASDALEPGRPSDGNRDRISQRAFWGDDVDVELRELYVDGTVGRSFLRIGKQQVVWGEADGLKVLDVVNPQSFREFILPDFDDSRIPLWTVNNEISLGESLALQVVWVPDQTYHDVPDAGAAFEFTSPRLVPQPLPGVPARLLAPDRPSKFLEDSDAGARLRAFLGGWELSLNYFFHYLDIPVLRRSLAPGGIEIRQDYERSHLAGGSFNNAFGDFVLRGEVAYSSDKFYLTSGSRDADGIAESDEITYVLGLDWSGLENTFISAQLFQGVILDDRSDIVQDEVDTTLTFFLRRTFANERVKFSSIVIQSVNDGDGVLESEITYEWRDNVELFLGVDVFYGTSRGLFGEFSGRDRVVAGVEVGI
ncbi:MAG: DUF1302 family protein [Gammaproteobacteria bacterium]